MITGLRGRAFISYRWGGERLSALVEWISQELVQRGYEVVFDKWYQAVAKDGEDLAVPLARELNACNLYVAVLTPGYVTVLTGTKDRDDIDPVEHVVKNDGWVRDEWHIAVAAGQREGRMRGIGLLVGTPAPASYHFGFPTVEFSSSVLAKTQFDDVFGERLNLPSAI